MRKSVRLLVLLCLCLPLRVSPAAAAVVPVTFGPRIQRLQNLVDSRYGKGHIDVTKDYIGAHASDPDPWFWVGQNLRAVWVTMVKRDPHENQVGWYIEGGTRAITPASGGVLFAGQSHPREVAELTLPGNGTCFGFYVDGETSNFLSPAGVPGRPGVHGKRFYTNRKLNDIGPDGNGAIHAPYDGDVQALIFNVSRWTGSNTWLVCFEDQDTGALMISGDDDQGDDENDGGERRSAATKHDDDPNQDDDRYLKHGSNDDYSDVVFEVRADGATAVHPLTFGALKLIYR